MIKIKNKLKFSCRKPVFIPILLGILLFNMIFIQTAIILNSASGSSPADDISIFASTNYMGNNISITDENSTLNIPASVYPTDQGYLNISDVILYPYMEYKQHVASIHKFYEYTYASFKAPGYNETYIQRVDLYIKRTTSPNYVIALYLFPSFYNKTSNRIEPNRSTVVVLGSTDDWEQPVNDEGWSNITNIGKYLDNTKTYNDIWFLSTTGYGKDLFFEKDHESSGNLDEMYVYNSTSGISPSDPISLTKIDGDTVDLKYRLYLSPGSNDSQKIMTDNIESLDLRINSTNIEKTGLYNIEKNITCNEEDKNLELEFSMNWPNYTTEISKIDIKYGAYITYGLYSQKKYGVDIGYKVDFTILGLNEDLINGCINIELPKDWSNFKTWCGGLSFPIKYTKTATANIANITGVYALNGYWEIYADYLPNFSKATMVEIFVWVGVGAVAVTASIIIILWYKKRSEDYLLSKYGS